MIYVHGSCGMPACDAPSYEQTLGCGKGTVGSGLHASGILAIPSMAMWRCDYMVGARHRIDDRPTSPTLIIESLSRASFVGGKQGSHTVTNVPESQPNPNPGHDSDQTCKYRHSPNGVLNPGSTRIPT